MIGNLSTQIDLRCWMHGAAAGVDTSAAATSAIDTGEYSRALITLNFGTVADGGKCALTVKGCETASGTYSKIAEIAAETPTASKTWALDVPCHMRHLKIEYQRTGANVTIESGALMLYDGKRVPADGMGDVVKRIVI